jgi:hypothetical protein
MRSRIIKSQGSAASDLRTTDCETKAWETEVTEELNMDGTLCLPRGMIPGYDSTLCLPRGIVPGYFLAWQSGTVIKKTRQVRHMISGCS